MAIKPIEYRNVVLTAADDETAAIQLRGKTLWGIRFPSTFTGTNVTFTTSDGAVSPTYGNVRNFANDGAYTVAVAAGDYVPLDIRVTGALNEIKIASDGDEDADRTLILHIRENE